MPDALTEVFTDAMKMPLPGAAALRSPFQGHASGERPNRQGQIGVHLQAQTLPSVTQISTWIQGLAALREAMTTAFGCPPPALPRQTLQTEWGLLLHTGPEEFLLLGDDGTDRCALLRATIRADLGSVTDLSHARCRIRITGSHCCTVLNKLFALDLRPAAFPIGSCALSGTHHVPSLLLRQGPEAFDLLVFSTYAYDQLATVLDAAQEYGVALQVGV